MSISTKVRSQEISDLFDYLEAELRRLMRGAPSEPPTDPTKIARYHPGASIRADGFIDFVIDDKHQRYTMDPSFLAPVAVCRLLGGSFWLNPSRSPRSESLHLLPTLSLPSEDKVSAYRVIADPRPGQKVKEVGDHHRLLPENFTIKEGTPGDRDASKYRFGRLDFIEMVIRQLNLNLEQGGGLVPCSAADLERLLRLASLVSDLRSLERMARAGAI